jgi:hypothetical protein
MVSNLVNVDRFLQGKKPAARCHKLVPGEGGRRWPALHHDGVPQAGVQHPGSLHFFQQGAAI